MQFNDEQIKKAMACKSVDELLALAKAEGIELAEAEAEKFFAQIGERDLDLEDLTTVTGGGPGGCMALNTCGDC